MLFYSIIFDRYELRIMACILRYFLLVKLAFSMFSYLYYIFNHIVFINFFILLKGKKMKRSYSLGLILLLPLFLFGITAQCHAATMTYTDRGTFEAAAGSFDTENFQGVAEGTSTNNSSVDVGDFSVIANSGLGSGWNHIGTGAINNVNSTRQLHAGLMSGETLVFTFDTAINYWGADFMGLNDGVRRSVIDDGTDSYLSPIIPQQNSFFGFYSDVAFTTITFTGQSSSEGVGMDNVTYASASVPEPTTIALLGLGMIGLAGAEARRRRQKKAVDKS